MCIIGPYGGSGDGVKNHNGGKCSEGRSIGGGAISSIIQKYAPNSVHVDRYFFAELCFLLLRTNTSKIIGAASSRTGLASINPSLKRAKALLF